MYDVNMSPKAIEERQVPRGRSAERHVAFARIHPQFQLANESDALVMEPGWERGRDPAKISGIRPPSTTSGGTTVDQKSDRSVVIWPGKIESVVMRVDSLKRCVIDIL